jgi:hypothetical protein
METLWLSVLMKYLYGGLIYDLFLKRIAPGFTWDAITCPLYKDNQSSTNPGADGELITDYLSLIDLNSILRKLMKEVVLDCGRNGKLQHGCWLSILHQVIGKGEKIKLQVLATHGCGNPNMKCYNEKQLMRNTLELVEVVLFEEERTATYEDMERVGKSIEKKCLTKNS